MNTDKRGDCINSKFETPFWYLMSPVLIVVISRNGKETKIVKQALRCSEFGKQNYSHLLRKKCSAECTPFQSTPLLSNPKQRQGTLHNFSKPHMHVLQESTGKSEDATFSQFTWTRQRSQFPFQMDSRDQFKRIFHMAQWGNMMSNDWNSGTMKSRGFKVDWRRHKSCRF